MMLDDIKKLNSDRINKFYEPDHSGIIIIHDEKLSKKILAEFRKIKHEKFILKDHQNINNGQSSYSANNPLFMKIYQGIRKRIPWASENTTVESSFTKYPISNQGATPHRDFSHNLVCTITFFSNYSEFKTHKICLPIRPGDILIMRAPRDNSVLEKSLRPIHAIGIVPETMYTYEIRQTKNHP